MKIRKGRKREYRFYPDGGMFDKFNEFSYGFRRKGKLIRFLRGMFPYCLNGIVGVNEDYFGSYGTVSEYSVWYDYGSGDIRLVKLYKERYKNFKPSIVKRYFAFSDRRIRLMGLIGEGIKINTLDKSHVRNLVRVFYKSGFSGDVEYIGDDIRYIRENVEYIKNGGNPFFYWSDRCGYIRMRVIIEYFLAMGLISGDFLLNLGKWREID